MTFAARLESAFHARNSLLCVGLDPDPKRLPEAFAQDLDGLEAWLKGVVDATAEYAVAFKPQIAYFHPLHAEPVLERVCRYIRETHPEHILVLDAKRNDIGSTAMLTKLSSATTPTPSR